MRAINIPLAERLSKDMEKLAAALSCNSGDEGLGSCNVWGNNLVQDMREAGKQLPVAVHFGLIELRDRAANLLKKAQGQEPPVGFVPEVSKRYWQGHIKRVAGKHELFCKLVGIALTLQKK